MRRPGPPLPALQRVAINPLGRAGTKHFKVRNDVESATAERPIGRGADDQQVLAGRDPALLPPTASNLRGQDPASARSAVVAADNLTTAQRCAAYDLIRLLRENRAWRVPFLCQGGKPYPWVGSKKFNRLRYQYVSPPDRLTGHANEKPADQGGLKSGEMSVRVSRLPNP
jgi:hypothetical protein